MPSTDDDSLTDQVHNFLDGLGFADLTPDYRDERDAANDTIDEAFDPLPDELAEDPDLAEVNKVNVHDDGDDILVPVVTFLFEDAGEPALDTVWAFAGRALEAVQPLFADSHVRHYDLQFAYADEDEETVIYRRIAVHPPLVERYLTDASFDIDSLRAAVAEGDNGDDELPPVDWTQFDAQSMGTGAYSGSQAAIAAHCAGASAGAAAACAGTAAGAGGAAGCGGGM
ncbi:hypothetical protein ACNO8S_15110 [Haloarcula sp. KBTZ06]|uniref:hypothetical protein n=1 Tax=Haloarcula sp. KBTZ06 TaxID=3402682 RepID=UPI003B435A88